MSTFRILTVRATGAKIKRLAGRRTKVFFFCFFFNFTPSPTTTKKKKII